MNYGQLENRELTLAPKEQFTFILGGAYRLERFSVFLNGLWLMESSLGRFITSAFEWTDVI